MRELKNDASDIVIKIRNENEKIKESNKDIESENAARQRVWEEINEEFETAESIIENLKGKGVISDLNLNDYFDNPKPETKKLQPVVVFSDEDKVITTAKDWDGSKEIAALLGGLQEKRKSYAVEYNKEPGDTSKIEADIEQVNHNILLAKDTNKKVEMVNSFLEWQEANESVIELRQKYFNMLKSVNTGVKGLEIAVSDDEARKDIHLTYNGAYDADYFGNKDLEQRKISSYSGTQKTVICLLLQSYLLSKKPKAMRYLW